MLRWNKRIALVTGASSEIGAAVCKKLVDRGLTVIGCAKNADKVEALFPENQVKKDGGKLHAMKCDLKQEYEVRDVFREIREKYGRLHLVVNNVGLNSYGFPITGEPKDSREMFKDEILPHLYFFNREAVRLMREKVVQEGQIIHISSLADVNHKSSETVATNLYCGSNLMDRFPMNMLWRDIKTENTNRSHIRVTNVSPRLFEKWDAWVPDPETASTICERIPSLKPEDVAEAVELILQAPPRLNVSDIILDATPPAEWREWHRTAEFGEFREKKCYGESEFSSSSNKSVNHFIWFNAMR